MQILNTVGGYIANYVESYHWAYVGLFMLVFTAALVIDIRAHKNHNLSVANAATWSIIWIAVALVFAIPTGMMLGGDTANLYLTGWMLEKTLAVDNLIAFIAVFACFGLTAKDKTAVMYRVLHWGIIGAIAARFVFLFFMGMLVNIEGKAGEIIVALMGCVVLYTAVKMWRELNADSEDDIDYTQHFSVRWTKKLFPVEPSLADGKFFVRKNGRLHVTVAFLALVCVEAVDVLFAFDSMPTIAAVVKDPNVMLTGTIMAVAGLRALFFVLEALRRALSQLDKAVIGLLIYLGFKLIGGVFGIHISTGWNLGIVAFFLTAGIVASFIWKDEEEVAGETETKKEVSATKGAAEVA